MNELVFLKNEQALTTSLKVAEKFEKPHKDILEKIRFLAAEISATKLEDNYSPQFWEQTYTDTRGKTYPMFLMNRDGFTEIVGNLNGKKAREWKRKYFAAFNAMEAALAERQSEQWKLMRGATKDSCKELNDVIHELYLFAKANGRTATEEKFFMNFYKLMNKTLGINPKSRDKLPIWKLFDIDRLQFMAKTVIKGLLAKGEDYHLPYKKCKENFESYARIAFIPQRLLEG